MSNKQLETSSNGNLVTMSSDITESGAKIGSDSSTIADCSTAKQNYTTNSISKTWKMLSQGGSVFDGFLLAASQEVG